MLGWCCISTGVASRGTVIEWRLPDGQPLRAIATISGVLGAAMICIGRRGDARSVRAADRDGLLGLLARGQDRQWRQPRLCLGSRNPECRRTRDARRVGLRNCLGLPACLSVGGGPTSEIAIPAGVAPLASAGSHSHHLDSERDPEGLGGLSRVPRIAFDSNGAWAWAECLPDFGNAWRRAAGASGRAAAPSRPVWCARLQAAAGAAACPALAVHEKLARALGWR